MCASPHVKHESISTDWVLLNYSHSGKFCVEKVFRVDATDWKIIIWLSVLVILFRVTWICTTQVTFKVRQTLFLGRPGFFEGSHLGKAFDLFNVEEEDELVCHEHIKHFGLAIFKQPMFSGWLLGWRCLFILLISSCIAHYLFHYTAPLCLFKNMQLALECGSTHLQECQLWQWDYSWSSCI